MHAQIPELSFLVIISLNIWSEPDGCRVHFNKYLKHLLFVAYCAVHWGYKDRGRLVSHLVSHFQSGLQPSPVRHLGTITRQPPGPPHSTPGSAAVAAGVQGCHLESSLGAPGGHWVGRACLGDLRSPPGAAVVTPGHLPSSATSPQVNSD